MSDPASQQPAKSTAATNIDTGGSAPGPMRPAGDGYGPIDRPFNAAEQQEQQASGAGASRPQGK